jgi:hypothetical protein
MAAALITTFENLIGKTVNGVEVEKVDNLLGRCHVQFKIYGKDNGKEVKIGVAVIQQSNANAIKARLIQLADYQRFDLTRGCLIRSRNISQSARLAQQYLKQLLNEKAGKWAILKPELIKPLLAIFQVYKNCENYELSPEMIQSYIDEKGLVMKNPLILDILSEPSRK